jgi:hypothetical protein
VFDSLHGRASALVAPRGVLAGGSLALGELEAARTGRSVARCLEILLLGEEEDQRAAVARVRLRDIEIEERAHIAISHSVVRSPRCFRRLGGRYRNNQVRVLVFAVQVCGATIAICVAVGRGSGLGGL